MTGDQFFCLGAEAPCGCEIREEVHYELPDQPSEYIVDLACSRHRYDARGLRTTIPKEES